MGLPVFKIDFYQYFLSFEKLMFTLRSNADNLKDFDFNCLRQRLQNLAYKYYYNFKPYKTFSAIISKTDQSLLKNFASNKDIVVCKPDKGRGVVTLDKTKYLEGMTRLISDTSKFKVLNSTIQGYTMKIETKINSFLRSLKNMGKLSEELYKKLYISGSSPGILYGLPKIHKKNFSLSNYILRPIFAAYNTPSYGLAKLIVKLLTPFSSNEFTVYNSYSFANEIRNFPNANKYVMASFDVENLFTNVPLVETINICLDTLFKTNDNIIGLNKIEFKKFLDLSILNSFFIFDGKLYEQVDGLGMGLPHSPTLANLFLSHHESIWLDNCPLNFKPVLYRRYVDDCFLLFRKPSHVNKFLNFLNSKHQNIKFTCELENDSALAFLDIEVLRRGNDFATSVFRKSTYSGLGTSFHSSCDNRFKINSIKTLISRGYKICSSYFLMHAEFLKLKKFFINNGYPKNLFESCVKKFLNSINGNCKNFDVKKKDLYLTLPYFGDQSIKLKKEICQLVQNAFPYIKTHIILLNKRTIGSHFRFKDSLPVTMRSSVIYIYSCTRSGLSYIGETHRHLFERIAEHRGVSWRTGMKLRSPPQSNILEHSLECGCRVEASNFKILSSARWDLDRKILESLLICNKKPSLNNHQSSLPLSIL